MMDAGLDKTRDDWDTTSHEDGRSNEAPRQSAGMRGLPDPSKLARDWITLWQSELSAMAAEPEIRDSWQTMLAFWTDTMTAIARGALRDELHDGTARRAGSADAPRPPATAAAPDARDAEIDRLTRHIAALERRLADLERGGDTPVHPKVRPGRKPRR